MNDTVSGKLTLLKSQFEGVKIAIFDALGSSQFKGVLQSMSDGLGALTPAISYVTVAIGNGLFSAIQTIYNTASTVFNAVKNAIQNNQPAIERLHNAFDNVRNSSGAIFMDFLNKPDFSHFNTIIYGHNMRIGTMFGSLKKLLNDPSIIKEDPYIYIFTKEKVMMYEICAAYITNDSSHTYDLTQTAEEQADYVKYIRNAGKD